VPRPTLTPARLVYTRNPTPAASAAPAAVRRAEHFAHMVAHPVDGLRNELRYQTGGRVKRLMHRAVDKACCSIM
jgi:hypothetical protein